MISPVSTTVFIDWDSARRIVPPKITKRSGDLRSVGGDAIILLQNLIAERLKKRRPRYNHRVTLRLYHGWHTGKSPTADRIELEDLVSSLGLQRTINNCSFTPELHFGSLLLCGGRRSQIMDTLRSQTKKEKKAQKMVDTSLTSDLLCFAKQNPSAVSIVVGDDDDLAPGVITADAWGHTTFISRVKRPSENKHLEIKDLILS